MTFIKEYSILPSNCKSVLHDLGLKYKCDKATVKCFCCPVRKKCSNKRSYLYNYEKHMKNRNNIKLLEIGVRDGASIKIWKEYFSKDSKIYGIDIDPTCNHCLSMKNTKIIIGDCNDKNSLNKIKMLNIKFDYIIDDGSHTYEDISNSLEYYYPLLKKNGIYIIEDLATMYRISKKTVKDLKCNINKKFSNCKIFEYPEVLVIQKEV